MYVNLKQSKKEYLSHFSYGDNCNHCGGINHPYMVQNKLWNLISKRKKFVCLTCFELILGRPLKVNDFTEAPINHGCFGFNCKVYVSLRDD